MKRIFFFLLVFCTSKIVAQIPEDAIRYSWYPQNGTARSLGSGAAMGSAGGDLTAAFVNPAGIGFFKVNEALITPGFLLTKNKFNYRGNASQNKKNAFAFGPTGVIFSLGNNRFTNSSSTVAIAATQNAGFNNVIQYRGLNNYSSFSEQFADEFVTLNKKGLSIDDVLNRNSVSPYTAAPALYTYLVDTVTINGKTIVKAAPEYILNAGQALQQEMTKTTKGGLYELAFTYAQNNNEKFMWGATLGVPLVSYESNTVFNEKDTSANRTNNFNSFSYNDNFKTTGAGLNLKLGLIYRPKEYIRLGLAVHTPSYMALTDSRRATLHTELENPVKSFDVKSDVFTNDQRGESKYIQQSPWRALISAAYVFREVEDVTRQRGFLSADVEYVNHSGGRFKSDQQEQTSDEKIYYDQLNSVVKNIYRGNINVRVGGEIKFNTIMGRLGFGYYGNPYKDAPSNANKMTLSGGLGYRNKGFFIDVAYVHLITKDFDIPYRLENAQTTYAELKQQRGNAVLTFGVKF
jgi:hypothetical protein